MLDDFLNIKTEQKNNILNLTSVKRQRCVDRLFRVDEKHIYFNDTPIDLERFLLDKLELNDCILKAIEDEANILANKMSFLLKSKEDRISKLKSMNNSLEGYINKSIVLKNKKINDVLGVIKGEYTNIIPYVCVFKDNLNSFNGKYNFVSGERFLLNKNNYNIVETIPNEKLEINFKDKNHINYILFNNALDTLDSFSVSILKDNKEIYTNKELNISKHPLLEVNDCATRIIITGVGTRAVISDIVICIGKKIYDLNRGVIVYEADFSETKLPDCYHISCNEDIKIFTIDKKVFNKQNTKTYQEFKEKYFDIKSNIATNQKVELDLQNNFLITFVETEKNALSNIKIYGVD